ncbi:hypothetical protein FHP25_21175 [Vineibacter terrae]|uniref:Lipoprotein n=1 Tax=Vineibacter terrae TaxID=2586908 RepID=A0A5C8PIV3_9HYPH|nr:hypothetical protein [Vineibacter terrae]TXL73447.1 hypothetical protein FHP25_21175 [Vineibacter terrae]
MAVALIGCGETPRPFAPDNRLSAPSAAPPGVGPETAEAPEFVITPPVGPRTEVAEKIATALALALRDHGIVAIPATARGLKRISATVATRDADGAVQIDITWTVQDERGTRIAGNDQRVLGSPQDWFNAEDRLISRIATQAAFRIGRQLGRGDLANVPIAALPDALPPGTLPPPPSSEPAGPGAPAPAADQPGGPPPGAPSPPAAPPGPEAPPSAAPPVLAAASNAPRVRVLTVTGGPDTANKALASAMRRAMGESQMVLVDRTEATVFQIQGSVALAAPAEGRQRVVIRWIIKRGDGTQIGDLEQANTVQAGSLEGNWDKLAPIVALAAADGVVELINRDRAAQGQR